MPTKSTPKRITTRELGQKVNALVKYREAVELLAKIGKSPELEAVRVDLDQAEELSTQALFDAAERAHEFFTDLKHPGSADDAHVWELVKSILIGAGWSKESARDAAAMASDMGDGFGDPDDLAVPGTPAYDGIVGERAIDGCPNPPDLLRNEWTATPSGQLIVGRGSIDAARADAELVSSTTWPASTSIERRAPAEIAADEKNRDPSAPDTDDPSREA